MLTLLSLLLILAIALILAGCIIAVVTLYNQRKSLVRETHNIRGERF